MDKYIETVKQMIADGQVAQDVAEKYFPELKESEDERVRKVLIALVKCSAKSGYKMFNNVPTSSMLAWLEKQKANTTHADWNDYKDKPVEVWNAYVRGLNIGMERGKKAVVKSPKDYGLEKHGEQNLTLPKWKYKKDNTPLLRDSLILNKYGCVAKSPSGAIVSDVWIIDYDELAKLPKEELEKQGEQKSEWEKEDDYNTRWCIQF